MSPGKGSYVTDGKPRLFIPGPQFCCSDMDSEGCSVLGTFDPVIETSQESPNTGLRHRTRIGNLSQIGIYHLSISGSDNYEQTKR